MLVFYPIFIFFVLFNFSIRRKNRWLQKQFFRKRSYFYSLGKTSDIEMNDARQSVFNILNKHLW